MSRFNRTIGQQIRDEVESLPYPNWVCVSYGAKNTRLSITLMAVTSADDKLKYVWGFVGMSPSGERTLRASWDTLMEAATFFEFGGTI